MSAECTAWVYRYSPATGAALLVHLAAADSANDQHEYELWMRQSWLSTKARVSRRACTDALAWLTSHGLLELLESGKKQGSANRYRFLMPDLAVVFDSRPTQTVPTGSAPRAHPGTQTMPTPVGTTCAQNPMGNSTPDPKPEQTAAVLTDESAFDAFWRVYPRRDDKPRARSAFARAIKSTSAAAVIAGAERYRDDPNRLQQYTKMPTTWLNAGSWENEPLPARTGNGRPAQRILGDEARGGESRVLTREEILAEMEG